MLHIHYAIIMLMVSVAITVATLLDEDTAPFVPMIMGFWSGCWGAIIMWLSAVPA